MGIATADSEEPLATGPVADDRANIRKSSFVNLRFFRNIANPADSGVFRAAVRRAEHLLVGTSHFFSTICSLNSPFVTR